MSHITYGDTVGCYGDMQFTSRWNGKFPFQLDGKGKSQGTSEGRPFVREHF